MNRSFGMLAALACLLIACGDDGGTQDPVDNEPGDHTVVPDDAEQPDTEQPDEMLCDTEPDDEGILVPDDDASDTVPVYCTLAANATFAYIYDGNGDLQAQLNANQSGYLTSAVFTGGFGDLEKPVPPAAAVQTIAFSYHLAASGGQPAQIIVTQQSFDGNHAVVSPFVQMSPPSDVITPGQFSVDASKAGSGYVILANSLGVSNCLLAYSFGGSITVTEATNTSAASGGSLAFVGNGLLLYYPTETPVGDISSKLSGITVCPKE